MLKLWGHGLIPSSLRVPPTNTRWNTKLDFALFGWINSTIPVKVTKPWKPETLILWNAIAGFSIRAGGRRNSPAISLELATYFSLEITPVFFFWEIVNAETRNVFKKLELIISSKTSLYHIQHMYKKCNM